MRSVALQVFSASTPSVYQQIISLCANTGLQIASNKLSKFFSLTMAGIPEES
jgi:hypothetical protein